MDPIEYSRLSSLVSQCGASFQDQREYFIIETFGQLPWLVRTPARSKIWDLKEGYEAKLSQLAGQLQEVSAPTGKL